MAKVLNSKKILVTLVGIVAVLVLSLTADLEVLKYAGGLVAGMVSAFNLGQGVADGWSKGRTSTVSGELNKG